jgi:hypothetical protein
MTFVSRPEQVLVHFNHFGCLSDDSTVDHSLVVRFDGSGVMQDDYFSLEVVDSGRSQVLVNEDHALSEVVPLQLVLLSQ